MKTRILKTIKAIGMGALILGASFGMVGCNTALTEPVLTYNDTQVNAMINDTKAEYEILLEDTANSAEQLILEKDQEIEYIRSQLDVMILADAKDEAEKLSKELEISTSYFIDEVALNENFADNFDNDDYEKLLEYEIEYDDEDYDVEESIILSSGIKPQINVEDFGSEVLLSFDKDSVEYKVTFDEAIDFVSDEDLEFKFLGEDVVISEFDGDNTVTFSTGVDLFLQEGTTQTYGDYLITLETVSTNGEKILVKVTKDGVSMSDTIREDKTETINGLDIEVVNAFSKDDGLDFAELKVSSNDVEFEIDDGDEYELDDRYDWKIVESNGKLESIGLILTESYTKDDELLSLGKCISLPNDYLSFTFDNIDNDIEEELEIKLNNEEVEIDFSGDIWLDDNKVTDVVFDLEEGIIDFSEIDDDEVYNVSSYTITLEVDDRKFDIQVNDSFNMITIGDKNLTYDSSYEFNESSLKNYGFDDEEDVRLINGDILYSVDDDYENVDSVVIGLIDDEDLELTLKVN